MRKQRQAKRIIFLFVFLFLLVGCTTTKLSNKKTTVEGKGATFTFQLPAGWEKQDYYQDIYGTQAVYGAEDTKSNSNMAVIIVSNDQIEKKGFGERTRQELAQQNGYQEEEDVFYVHETINENDVFKYTFETSFNGKTVWGHYYSVFCKDAVIQFLYYSADDSSYEKRVAVIDQSIETVEETKYDKKKAEEEAQRNKADELTFSTDSYEVKIVGLGTLKDEQSNELVALRYTFTNQSSTEQMANSWIKDITLSQANKELESTKIATDSMDYEIVHLQESAEKKVSKGNTEEGVILYSLNGKASLSLALKEGVQSEKSSYTLQLPK